MLPLPRPLPACGSLYKCCEYKPYTCSSSSKSSSPSLLQLMQASKNLCLEWTNGHGGDEAACKGRCKLRADNFAGIVIPVETSPRRSHSVGVGAEWLQQVHNLQCSKARLSRGKPKVNNAGREISVQKDVVGPDISMYNGRVASHMQKFQSSHCVPYYLQPLLSIQTLRVAFFKQGLLQAPILHAFIHQKP
ncbi:hypothetical protein GOP47_0006563 [Adiantum capillus-veneris]|uniref:Uncharacterized protein n=1 Tax=Adiantum capillus-veneris TaxID=13818 RepID=A0A9D4ZM62_ADICA|nr:hypothetical protein GOP47_0006563 [Adiantum capillus-veneris]